MKQKLRCACGKSKQMPWCDGSHKGEDWACEHVIVPTIKRAFMGAANLQNLTKRLAWRFDGEVINTITAMSGEQLVIIEDGSSIAGLKTELDNLHFDQVFFVGVDFPTQLIAESFHFSRHIQLNGALSDIFVQLESTIKHWFNGSRPFNTPNQTYHCDALNKVFISHAVADESTLLPTVDSIRQITELEVFLCFDSIDQGEKWRRKINAALDDCQLFIFVVSKSSVQSTYCAYEIGYAVSKGKNIALISVDGSLPPAFVSHLHCIDLQRVINAKPWLDVNSALLSHILAITTKACEPISNQ